MSFTIVTGYWNVTGKYSSDTFKDWMKNTLSINAPYVFFGNSESIEIAKVIRKDLPTYFIKLEMDEFYSYKYRDTICAKLPHVPSTEVNLILNEKVNLVQRAMIVDPFKSDFFMWIDAGIYTYRGKPPPTTPFPNPEKVKNLPFDKFIFCTTDKDDFEGHKVHENHYYHYVSGNFIMHKNIIKYFASLYRTYMDKYLSRYNWLNTEQKLLTHMYADFPDLFYKFSNGYASIVKELE